MKYVDQKTKEGFYASDIKSEQQKSIISFVPD